jgi:HEPN domain-containing protein
MHNDDLCRDYLRRAHARLQALGVLSDLQSWADVVRESQEVVELSLKALVRWGRIEVPRVHDVSPVLDQNRDRFPAGVRARLDELIRISRSLRRDRELAFYGSEDLTPSLFYTEADAAEAAAQARTVVACVAAAMGPDPGQQTNGGMGQSAAGDSSFSSGSP